MVVWAHRGRPRSAPPRAEESMCLSNAFKTKLEWHGLSSTKTLENGLSLYSIKLKMQQTNNSNNKHLSPSRGLADRIKGWAAGSPGSCFPVAHRLHCRAPRGNCECREHLPLPSAWSSRCDWAVGIICFPNPCSRFQRPWPSSHEGQVLKPGSAGMWCLTVPEPPQQSIYLSFLCPESSLSLPSAGPADMLLGSEFGSHQLS